MTAILCCACQLANIHLSDKMEVSDASCCSCSLNTYWYNGKIKFNEKQRRAIMFKQVLCMAALSATAIGAEVKVDFAKECSCRQFFAANAVFCGMLS